MVVSEVVVSEVVVSEVVVSEAGTEAAAKKWRGLINIHES